MSNVCKEIIELMPPPKNPLNARGDWKDAEAKLGFKFPPDYKQFIELYGDGHICGFFYVKNPFSEHRAFEMFRSFAFRLKTHWEVEDTYEDARKDNPFRFYPGTDGVFKWGYTDNGQEFFWQVRGAPSRWNVVVQNNKWTLVKGKGFSETVLGLVTGRLREFKIPKVFLKAGPRFEALDR